MGLDDNGFSKPLIGNRMVFLKSANRYVSISEEAETEINQLSEENAKRYRELAELKGKIEAYFKLAEDLEKKGFVDDGFLTEETTVFDHNQPKKLLILNYDDWKKFVEVFGDRKK